MANSSLATWKWSGTTDHYNIRDHKIDTITIHHMAGNLTLAGCCSAVQSRGGSCNYCIDSNGNIGVMIDEKYRSWCSSNRANDMRAVTIEVANDSGDPNWHVSDKALASVINLCVDICKRNGIAKLNYTGNTSGNMTMHKWFEATGCPGPYLGGKFSYIASEVNKRLTTPTKTLDKTGMKQGDKNLGVYELKSMLSILEAKGKISTHVTVDNGFGSGTTQIVNSLLKSWGYVQNGVAGTGFVDRVTAMIKK